MLGLTSWAQPSDLQLAKHYYDNGEYDKARLYYEKLYEQQPSHYYYQSYFNTLLALEEYKDAEKLIKKQRKYNPNNIDYQLDLATVYEKTDRPDKAEDIYEEAVKDVGNNYTAINSLGDAFVKKGMLERALIVYQEGKRKVKNYPFGFKVAEIQGKLGNNELMIEEYLDVAVEYPNYMVSIQNSLARLLDFEEPKNPKTDQLRISILKRTQSNPDQTIYNEMLIWYFLQIRDFNMAMIQGQALDRRIKDSRGDDVIQLARMCKANQAYDVAIKGYDYIIKNYPEGLYVNAAYQESMEALYLKVTTSDYTQDDLLNLEGKYETLLGPEQMGKNYNSVPIMRQLAHIEGFYLHNLPKAISILVEALEIPRITAHETARCKLALGDMYTIQGKVWDASLYYMQVEKTFKEDILGHEAKFRNARIYYYTGQFEWAQAQLDVLKASTSKLIANDAMQLSLTITDNLGLDTTTAPMMLFASADLLIFQNKLAAAKDSLDVLTNVYGDHALSDEILYKRYEIAKKERDWNTCVKHLNKLIENHGDDILGDDATYELARIYHYQLKDIAKAKEYYKKIIFDYEGSIYTTESRKQFRALGGNDAREIKPIILNPEDVKEPQ